MTGFMLATGAFCLATFLISMVAFCTALAAAKIATENVTRERLWPNQEKDEGQSH